MLLGERREPHERRGSGGVQRDPRSLASATQAVEVLRTCLVLASEARPAQPPGLLLLGLAQRVQQTADLREAQLDALVGSSPFFSRARACPCITTRAA
jgi:hypothetical protein